MFVGIARLVLHLPGARTLKDRRQVVRSFKERLRARLPVSIAEVGELETPQLATLGLTVVAREAEFCDSVLAQARAMASELPEAELTDARTELLPFGAGGSGLPNRYDRRPKVDAAEPPLTVEDFLRSNPKRSGEHEGDR